MEFNIGDRIRVKDYEAISADVKTTASTEGNPHLWNAGKAKNCGQFGTITDKLYSETYECYIFRVTFDGQKYPSRALYDAESLEYPKVVTEFPYTFQVEYAGNLMIVRMFKDGEEIEKGHGHIIHNGAIGIAQATSYALKKLYEKLNGGKI